MPPSEDGKEIACLHWRVLWPVQHFSTAGHVMPEIQDAACTNKETSQQQKKMPSSTLYGSGHPSQSGLWLQPEDSYCLP